MTTPKDCHSKFTAWSENQGLTISDKVKPMKFPGRGVGVISLEKIHAGEQLVFVPRSALLTVEDVPTTFQKKIGNVTVHGLLASFLAFGPAKDRARYLEWEATWPTDEDLRECMPILWPKAVRSSQQLPDNLENGEFRALPPAISDLSFYDHASGKVSGGLLHVQERNFSRDWVAVSRALSTAKYQEFLYYWLIVNTRSFYYELPSRGKTQPKADRMVLCPFVDYFNHTDYGCHVEYDPSGFTVTSDREYDTGQELYTSYGNHSNDFLLAEYGFFLQNNAHDSLPLDRFVLRILDDASQTRLEEHNYLKNYTLYPPPKGSCHRTAVAIRTQTLNLEDWNLFVLGETLSIGEAHDEELANDYIASNVLKPYLDEAERNLRCFGNDTMMERLGLDKTMWETLKGRWVQIKELLETSLDELQCGDRNGRA